MACTWNIFKSRWKKLVSGFLASFWCGSAFKNDERVVVVAKAKTKHHIRIQPYEMGISVEEMVHGRTKIRANILLMGMNCGVEKVCEKGERKKRNNQQFVSWWFGGIIIESKRKWCVGESVCHFISFGLLNQAPHFVIVSTLRITKSISATNCVLLVHILSCLNACELHGVNISLLFSLIVWLAN